MSINGNAYIAGAWEHPTRKAHDKTLIQLHAEMVKGALDDAGLDMKDVDGFFCASDVPGLGALNISEYLGIRPTYMDNTDTGGSSYVLAVGHVAQAIAEGKCSVAVVTLAGKPRTGNPNKGEGAFFDDPNCPDVPYELPFGHVIPNLYGMCAARHMHEFGTTSEQLAWVKVAASHHAQHNENAMLRDVVTVEDVVNSPMISDPLHKLDCCVISDGGGALVVVSPEIARSLNRPLVRVRGAGEAVKHLNGGKTDLTFSGAVWSGPKAFEEAGVTPADIKYVSIYDSFTITVIMTLEDLGFCEKGRGGAFVADGNLISGQGKLPFNTDGGGLCSNHPGNRGGMTKVIEAVRQLRGEAHPKVQVPGCDLALAHGTGGFLGSRHGSATLIMERE